MLIFQAFLKPHRRFFAGCTSPALTWGMTEFLLGLRTDGAGEPLEGKAGVQPFEGGWLLTLAGAIGWAVNLAFYGRQARFKIRR